MKLKYQLPHLLKVNGLTASQLAREADVPKQSISDWMAGVSPRKLEHLKRVADVLEVSLDTLCFGNGPGNEEQPPLDGQWIEGVFEGRFRKVKL